MNEDFFEKPEPTKESEESIETTEQVVRNILHDIADDVCSYLGVARSRSEELTMNVAIKLEQAGHNNQIAIVDLFDDQGEHLGEVCLKYSSEPERSTELHREGVILDTLSSNGMHCPSVIGRNFSGERHSYILMETVPGEGVIERNVDVEEANAIRETIQSHETILRENLQYLQSSADMPRLDEEIDFEGKASKFLMKFGSHLKLRDSLAFLNAYLNDQQAVSDRVLATDRASDNIFIDEEGDIHMIDFSTVRAGTQFDNWIQFIDDPRATFQCSREELVGLFFEKNDLPEERRDTFHAASIYTNLLQGIFTHQKKPHLGFEYIKNVNNAFRQLGKKDALIDVNY